MARLGYELAYSTAVSIAVEQILQSKSVGKLREHLKNLWKHSVYTSAIAYVIAKRHTRVNPDEAMLAGLLHHIGKFYLLTRSEKYAGLFEDEAAMGELMRNWHTGIGHAILESWGFSEDITATANEHDDLGRPHAGAADLTDVVIAANLCANRNELADDFDWTKVTAAMRLKLDQPAFQQILKASNEEIQSIMQALD